VNDIIRAGWTYGTLTPVAVLEPVQVGGSCQPFTLHNMDEIERLGLHIATRYSSNGQRSNPHVLKVVKEGKNRKPFRMPKECPECAARSQVEGKLRIVA